MRNSDVGPIVLWVNAGMCVLLVMLGVSILAYNETSEAASDLWEPKPTEVHFTDENEVVHKVHFEDGEMKKLKETTGDIVFEDPLVVFDGSNSWVMEDDPVVISARACLRKTTLLDDGVEMVYTGTYSQWTILIVDPEYGPDVWKLVYRIKDGRLVFDEVVHGNYVAAHIVPESWSFESGK